MRFLLRAREICWTRLKVRLTLSKYARGYRQCQTCADGLSAVLEAHLTESVYAGIMVNVDQPRWYIMSRTTTPETVRYAILPSPIGELLVAAIDQEVVHVAFQNHNFERVIERLQTQFGGPVLRDDEALKFATQQFEEYFAGTRKSFELATRQPTPDRFLSEVQQSLATIPYGETLSYGELAIRLARPGAARAVGSACARNPMPLIQPCHRVVRADGSYGEFSGTPEAKEYLLAFERGDRPHASTS